MSGKCTGCGDCCAVVSITKPIWERTTQPRMEGQSYSADDAFLLKNWHEITPLQAAQVSPYGGAPLWVDFWTEAAKRNALLRCDAFDYATRTCTAYETRPNVCKGFPWYDGVETASATPLWRLFRCGYWGDVKEDWPAWVDVVELARQGISK